MTTLIICKWDCYEKTNRITEFLFPASINIMKDTTKEIDKSRSGNEPPARACELFCILVQNPIHFVDIRLGRANSFLMKLTINWQSDMTHIIKGFLSFNFLSCLTFCDFVLTLIIIVIVEMRMMLSNTDSLGHRQERSQWWKLHSYKLAASPFSYV